MSYTCDITTVRRPYQDEDEPRAVIVVTPMQGGYLDMEVVDDGVGYYVVRLNRDGWRSYGTKPYFSRHHYFRTALDAALKRARAFDKVTSGYKRQLEAKQRKRLAGRTILDD